MPIPLDVITRKKLILVKQIYQRAVVQSAVLHSDFDRIMSLIAFDLANETALKAVVGALEPSKPTDKQFHGVVQQADDTLQAKGLPEVPDKAKIRHVHDLRNDTQHKAKYPNPSDVSDSRTYTRDFLRQLVTNVWGEDFDSISLIDVIRHQRARTLLEEANEYHKQGNLIHAVGYAKAACQLAIGKAKRSLVGGYADTLLGVFPGDDREAQLVEAIKKISDTVFLSVVGLDYPSYFKFHELSWSVSAADFGDHLELNDFGVQITAQDAEYIINYAVNSVIQIESLVGDIEKPFQL